MQLQFVTTPDATSFCLGHREDALDFDGSRLTNYFHFVMGTYLFIDQSNYFGLY